MKLKLQNILKVASADIELGGLTVITGENDSGKSTVGKILFSTLKAANNVNQIDKVNTLGLLRGLLSSIKRLFYRFEQDVHILGNIKSLSIDLIEKNVSVQEFSSIIEEEAKKCNFTTRTFAILQKYIVQIQLYIAELDNPVLAVKREFEIISKSEFMEPLNSHGKEFSTIEFHDDTTDATGSGIKMKFENGELIDVAIQGSSSIEDVTYIESPVYLHILNTLRFYSSVPTISFSGISNSPQRGDIPYHLADMAEKILSTQDEILGLFDNYNAINNKSLLKEISSLIGGDFTVDKKNKQLFFKRDGNDIPTVSVASGIKSFGVLLRLIQADCVSTSKMLVIDEPEIHSRGTPITGRVVIPAITPGRAAASPAPAIITSKPSSSHCFTVLCKSSPARCAEIIKALYSTPNSLRTSAALLIFSVSDFEPKKIATFTSVPQFENFLKCD